MFAHGPFFNTLDVHKKEPQNCYKTVVFGVSTSSFLVNAVIRHHLNKYKGEYPTFTRDMIEGFLVDNLLKSCKNTSEAYALYEKAKQRMQEAGLKLRKWKTNDKPLRELIARNECKLENWEEEDSHEDCSYAKEIVGLSRDEGGRPKVFGINWDTDKDISEFDVGKVGHIPYKVVTKRGILSTLASIFDPLGLICPIALSAKVLFQELCLQRRSWDDSLPADKVRRWEV